MIATLPTLPTTGNTDVDSALVLYIAVFAGLGVLIAIFANTKTGVIVVQKVQKYAAKLL